MTAIRLKSGRLLLYNPVKMTPASKEWICQLGGEVAYIMSPCSAHTLWMKSAKDVFPTAKIIASSGAADKFAKLSITCDFIYSDSVQLTAANDELMKEGVELKVVHGHTAQTSFLWHSASGTLLECDIDYTYAWQAPTSTCLPSITAFGKGMRATVCKCSPNGVLPTYNFASMDESNPLCNISASKPDRKLMKSTLEHVLSLPIKKVISSHDGEVDTKDFIASVKHQWIAWL
jgi:hypothetical protein